MFSLGFLTGIFYLCICVCPPAGSSWIHWAWSQSLWATWTCTATYHRSWWRSVQLSASDQTPSRTSSSPCRVSGSNIYTYTLEAGLGHTHKTWWQWLHMDEPTVTLPSIPFLNPTPTKKIKSLIKKGFKPCTTALKCHTEPFEVTWTRHLSTIIWTNETWNKTQTDAAIWMTEK